jgi:ComF family protein
VRALGAFCYEEPVSSILQRFKYQAHPELARRLARAIVERTDMGSLVTRGAVLLVPVPIHPERLASRGYNQSGLLACRLAERLGARVQLRALCRSSNTRAQAKSSKRERERNLDNQIQPRARLKGSFILVDDVLTTGATASACLGALRRGGGVPLAVLTVAIAE